MAAHSARLPLPGLFVLLASPVSQAAKDGVAYNWSELLSGCQDRCTDVLLGGGQWGAWRLLEVGGG